MAAAGRVAELLPKAGHHRIHDAGVARRGGVVVEVDRKLHDGRGRTYRPAPSSASASRRDSSSRSSSFSSLAWSDARAESNANSADSSVAAESAPASRSQSSRYSGPI